FTRVAGLRGLAHEIGSLLREVTTHFVRQRLHHTEAEECRGVSCVTAVRALAVALQECVVGLGAGAGGSANPMTRRAGDGFRPTEKTGVHAAKRPGAGLCRGAATQPVGKAVLMFEDELPEIGELRQTHLSG